MLSKFSSLFFLIAGLILGGGIGFFIGHSDNTHPTSVTIASAENSKSVTPYGSPLEERYSHGGDSREITAAVPITSAELCRLLEEGGLGGMHGMRTFVDLQDRLRASNIATIASEIIAAPSSRGRDAGIYVVMSTFAERDPQAAWDFAQSISSHELQHRALRAVVLTVTTKDPARAMAMVNAVQDAQAKRQLRMVVIAQLAQQDPQHALDLSMAEEDPSGRDISTIFSIWAREDAESAKAALANLRGHTGEQARRALISSLAQTDPQAAWNYAITLPPSDKIYNDARVQVIQSWAQSDPQAALKAALSIAEPESRGPAVSSVVSTWARSDFHNALQYAVGIKDSALRSDVFRTMSLNPSTNHKDLLDAILSHMPPGDNFQQAVSGIFSSWAIKDPAAAATAISQLPPGKVFSSAASQIASQWAQSESNKQKIIDWVRELPEGEARRNAYHSVFSEWSSDSPQDAIRALNTLSPEDRGDAVQALALGWSRKDPEAVLQWSSTLSDSRERSGIVQSAISQWASISPESAIRYIDHLPETSRVDAMRIAVERWASKDTEAAAEWLRKQPQGPAKDAAIFSLSRKISLEDPETALAWAATISNTAQRTRQTEILIQDWLRQDVSAARAWISRAKLPEGTRERLLRE